MGWISSDSMCVPGMPGARKTGGETPERPSFEEWLRKKQQETNTQTVEGWKPDEVKEELPKRVRDW